MHNIFTLSIYIVMGQCLLHSLCSSTWLFSNAVGHIMFMELFILYYHTSYIMLLHVTLWHVIMSQCHMPQS